MTSEDAYIEGFCKTAENFGIDPEVLVKIAQAAAPAAPAAPAIQSRTDMNAVSQGQKVPSKPAVPGGMTYDDFARRAQAAKWKFDKSTNTWSNAAGTKKYTVDQINDRIAQRNGTRGVNVQTSPNGTTVVRNASRMTPMAQGNDVYSRGQNLRRMRQQQAIQDNTLPAGTQMTYGPDGRPTYTYNGNARSTRFGAGFVDSMKRKGWGYNNGILTDTKGNNYAAMDRVSPQDTYNSSYAEETMKRIMGNRYRPR